MVKDEEVKSKIFNKALEIFEKQFGVELCSTGYETDYSENDGIGEKEFWVNGLITTKANLNFTVGGWFSHDTRDSADNIYCLLALKLNGNDLGGKSCQALQSFFDNEKKEWSEIVWETY